MLNVSRIVPLFCAFVVLALAGCEGDDEVRCGSLVDVLPAGALSEGEYVFEASLRSARDPQETATESVRFAVRVPSGNGAAPARQAP